MKKPGVFEACVGLTLRELIYDLGGGILGDSELLGVIPGGSSTPVLRADEIGERARREVAAPPVARQERPRRAARRRHVPRLGTMLGTCCAIVMAEGT